MVFMEHGTRGPGADIAEVLCENQQHAAMQNTIYLFHTLLALLYWYIEINHYMPPSIVIEFGTGPPKTHTLNHPFITMQ